MNTEKIAVLADQTQKTKSTKSKHKKRHIKSQGHRSNFNFIVLKHVSNETLREISEGKYNLRTVPKFHFQN